MVLPIGCKVPPHDAPHSAVAAAADGQVRRGAHHLLTASKITRALRVILEIPKLHKAYFTISIYLSVCLSVWLPIYAQHLKLPMTDPPISPVRLRLCRCHGRRGLRGLRSLRCGRCLCSVGCVGLGSGGRGSLRLSTGVSCWSCLGGEIWCQLQFLGIKLPCFLRVLRSFTSFSVLPMHFQLLPRHRAGGRRAAQPHSSSLSPEANIVVGLLLQTRFGRATRWH